MTMPSADALDLTRCDFRAARTLPGEVYTSAEVFARERTAIFSRHWIYVGRSADLPAVGDFFVPTVAGESIIVVRGDDGEIRAFYNVCRHRGSRLIDSPAGAGLKQVLCPYHAWSYGLDGRLQTAPQVGDRIDRGQHGLVPVRVSAWEGLLFVCLDADCPPLADWLRDMPNLSRFGIAGLTQARRVEYDVHANWKLICENYSECYHCPGVHPQLHRLAELIGRDQRPMELGRCFNGGPMRLRDGIATMSTSGLPKLPPLAGLSAEDRRYAHYYVVYPTLLLSPHPDYVLIHGLWPLAPDRTRIVCEWLVVDGPAAVDAGALDDVVGFWDLTNRQDWTLCERAQAGVASRGYRQGPYQDSEDCVHMFDRWYADRLAGAR